MDPETHIADQGLGLAKTTPTPELKIDVASLQKYNLMIATPCYGGQENMNFSNSCMSLHYLLMRGGIAHRFNKLGNESLISRARNIITGQFLDSDCTHLLFIDGDIQFNPEDVFMMLHLDKPVIGGSYPMKGIDWKQIKETVLKHPDIPPAELASAGARWPIHFHETKYELTPYNPVEIFELATGFMMIKREVFEAIKPLTKSYARGMHEEDAGKILWDFYPTEIANDRYESEDYGFCRLWREAGGKVWLCPWMEFTHWGTYGFKGNLYKALELLNRENLTWQS